MSIPYQEVLSGTPVIRTAPGARHELICGRLHKIVYSSVANLRSTRLLPPRSTVEFSARTKICPDLALLAAATGKLWLAAEIVSSDDHRTDTVVKKQLYEEIKIPRLWMIDPRYDNIEVYHGSEYGLMLKSILAGREILSEKLLPEFQLTVAELFKAEEPKNSPAI
jgi:Uma2 family endonuclease